MSAVAFQSDDLRQAVVVARNEVKKFLSARKFLVYIGLVVLITALLTFLPYIVGDGLAGSSGEIFSSYIGYVQLLVILGVTLFASYTIVSEFEERTALILFTRPIRKSTIFIGKLVACYALIAVVLVLYYLVSMLVAYAAGGELVTSFLPSLAMCLLYTFACCGIAMLISSVFKKGGTAAVMTFITVLLLVTVVSAVLGASGIDTWFMLDSASSAITNSIPEYVDMTNQSMIQMGESLGVDVSGMMTEVADCVESGAVMAAWGAVTLVLSYILFARREF